MAELVAGLFAAVSGSGAATAAAGAAATSALGTASTALGILQGVATAGSILTSLSAGRVQAGQARLDARQIDLNTQQEALRIRQDYVRKAGAMRVAFAGSGVDISGGQSQAIGESLSSQALFEEAISKNRGDLLLAGARGRQASAMIRTAGDVFGAAVNYGIDIARRG